MGSNMDARPWHRAYPGYPLVEKEAPPPIPLYLQVRPRAAAEPGVPAVGQASKFPFPPQTWHVDTKARWAGASALEGGGASIAEVRPLHYTEKETHPFSSGRRSPRLAGEELPCVGNGNGPHRAPPDVPQWPQLICAAPSHGICRARMEGSR